MDLLTCIECSAQMFYRVNMVHHLVDQHGYNGVEAYRVPWSWLTAGQPVAPEELPWRSARCERPGRWHKECKAKGCRCPCHMRERREVNRE